ncbi:MULTISPECIES: polysaccharide deacetylase family protein [Halomonadaceae]|uniref:polysaccharide deacetylase family protein n=1 Tax=Halomonadaceae TaxID=28256 RepID=UPI001599A5FD|nr:MULTISPECIES: polysaccharide deacetylase family protein [Halomonas]QJQ94161.1 polysaccharide deacetylase family protein [Halomonas sp. PA5]
MKGEGLVRDIAQRLRGHWRRSLAEPLQGRSAILVLHRVLPDEEAARLPHRAPYCLGPESFHHLLMSLVEVSRIVSLNTALKPHHDPQACIALTFDDGWRDNAEVAAPLLDHYALPASIFVTTGLLGRPRGFWWEVIGEGLWSRQNPERIRDALGDNGLPLPPMPPPHPDHAYSSALLGYMTQLRQADPILLNQVAETLHALLDQPPHGLDPFSVRRLENGGLMRFGAHGVLPESLEPLSDERICWHIRRSREDLKRLCHSPLEAFAFPDSTPSPRLRRLAHRCGVQLALAGSGGWLTPDQDPLAIPRIPISQPVAQSPGRLYDWLLGRWQAPSAN